MMMMMMMMVNITMILASLLVDVLFLFLLYVKVTKTRRDFAHPSSPNLHSVVDSHRLGFKNLPDNHNGSQNRCAMHRCRLW